MRSAFCILLIFVCNLAFSQQPQDTLEYFVEGKEDTTRFKVLRLKVNSDKSDFSPFMWKEELMFVSGRNREVGVDYVDANGETEITDLYRSTRVNATKFKNVKSFDSRLNTKYYEGPFCLNSEGSVLYFSANDQRTGLLKIYVSEKKEGRWSKPEMLSFCKDNYSYFHPALSPDGGSLVFSTDRNKEKNRIDLYRSSLANGGWDEPKALHALINDTNSQVFPFISKENMLYYSTDKKLGTGLDIYFVSLDSLDKQPRAMEFPINTKFDDFGVWIDSTGLSGYFSSNRVARFKDDIYYFTASMPDFKDSRIVIPKTQFCYSFVEESTLASKDTVNMTYEWNFGDGKKSRGLRTRHCFPGPGEYEVVLNVVDKSTGEVFTNETSYPLVIEKPDYLSVEHSDSLFVNTEINLKASDLYLKNCKFEKICWSFGDGCYNSGYSVKHRYKKPGTYTVQLGVVAKNKESDKTELYSVQKTVTIKNPNEK